MNHLRRLHLFALAVLVWLAVGANFFIFASGAIRLHQPAFYGIVVGLAFFTMQTNIWIATISTASIFFGHGNRLMTRPSTMAAALVYIFVVGTVYSLFLRPAHWQSRLDHAVQQSLHVVIPILYITYWAIFVPKGTLNWRHPWRWLLFPALYVVASLLLVEVADQHVYSFGDVDRLGYFRVVLNGIIILCTFLLLGFMVVFFDRILAHKKHVPQTMIEG